MQQSKTIYHNILANYFFYQPLFSDGATQNSPNVRKLIELTWQLYEAKRWQDLKNLLEYNITFWLVKAETSNNSIVENYRYWCNIATQTHESFNIEQQIGNRIENILKFDENSSTIVIKDIDEPVKKWSYNGISFIYATDHKIYTINVQNNSNRYFTSMPGQIKISDICISDTNLIVGVGLEDGTIELFDFISGIKFKILSIGSSHCSVSTYFVDRRYIVSARGDLWTNSGFLQLWDLNTGKMIKNLIIPLSFKCLLISPSNKIFWIDGENQSHNIDNLY